MTFRLLKSYLCWQNNWRPSQSSRVLARSSSRPTRCSWRRLRQNMWCAASNTPSPDTWCSSSTAQTRWMTSSCRRYQLRGHFCFIKLDFSVDLWRYLSINLYLSLISLRKILPWLDGRKQLWLIASCSSLCQVLVQMEPSESYEVIHYIPAPSLPYSQPGSCYTLVRLPDDDPTAGRNTKTLLGSWNSKSGFKWISNNPLWK